MSERKRKASGQTKAKATPAKKPADKVTARRPRGTGSPALTAFLRSYKGIDDYHIPVFKDVLNVCSVDKVLYPGCHRHITASIVFPDVVYIDNYGKVGDCFSDPAVLDFVEKNKIYSTVPQIKFKCKNFESNFGEQPNTFDLLISLNAGIVTTSCAKYVKVGGHMLIGDGHFDARQAFVNKNYELIAVYDDEKGKFDLAKEALEGHFITKDGREMTQALVDESIAKPKARRSFKLQKEALYYLFKKIA